MPTREIEICQRLLSARKALPLTRVAFARQAGIDSSQLRRYEEARAPLRYGDGKALCAALGLDLVWLATGEGSAQGISIVEDPPDSLGASSLFSEGFDRDLASILRKKRERWSLPLNRVAAEVRQILNLANVPTEVVNEVDELVSRLAADLNFERKLRPAIQRTAHPAAQTESHKIRIQALIAAGTLPLLAERFSRDAELQQAAREQEPTNPCLTRPEKRTESAPMSSLLAGLMSDVRRLTAAPGAPSALAKVLGVDRQRVSDWLKGTSMPSGEMALQLREWVREAEQEKEPGRVSAQPGRVTQKDKSNTNEKAKSSRRKR